MSWSLRWLALEVKDLDRAVTFYQQHLDLPIRSEQETEAVLRTGTTDLVLRRPTAVPRGGIHTHFAVSTPAAEYDDWWDRLSEQFDLTEFEFATGKSLYFYDPDGNCVEIGQSRDEDEAGITGMFEVVLEVKDLDRAEAFYKAVGFTVVDRGSDRQRIRLSSGQFALELWEPQLGIADARGGVHVDFGIETDDHSPTAVLDRIDATVDVEHRAEGVRVTDPAGHRLTLL